MRMKFQSKKTLDLQVEDKEILNLRFVLLRFIEEVPRYYPDGTRFEGPYKRNFPDAHNFAKELVDKINDLIYEKDGRLK